MSRVTAAPVGGSINTPTFRLLFGVFVAGMIVLAARFVFGLGATTAMNDGYPFGLWIALDVVTGTALACGGYAIAILVYILNHGKYNPLVRSAMLASALGYTMGGFSVVIDVGRWWNIYKVPLFFWNWNFNSILLEVALCIMVYTAVLWVEMMPAFLEKWKDSENSRLRQLARTVTPKLEAALPWIISLGLLLPTMHQSSLGSLMLLTGVKLHPLWQTPMLPLLFLISCIGMGYGVVVMESTLSTRAYKRRSEARTLASLSTAMVVVLILFTAIRIHDIITRQSFHLIYTSGRYSALFLVEMALFIVPIFMLLRNRIYQDRGYLFRAAVMILAAGTLYRLSTYLIAYNPGAAWKYFPAVGELIVSAGLVAAEIMAYMILVRRFPILAGEHVQPPRVRPLGEDVLKQVRIPSAAPVGAD